ncbi:PEGA domain-containing protein, partial [bacterium]|nr:PEGA domain-containing protein [bacterium]
MGKTLGRITYTLFFALFFIMAPLLTIYALGYRYDFNTGNIEKNGAFYIKSYPKNAEIYVDNIKYKNSTPTQLTNIRPGTRQITVEKEDYISWSKELKIQPGETTFAEDIVLFLNQRPKTVLSTGSEKFLVNQSQNKYAYLDADNQLIITDLEQAKNFEIFTFDKNYDLIEWSPDNQRILLKNKSVFYVFDINQKTLERLSLSLIQKIIWEDNSSYLLYLKNNNLFRYDISQPSNPSDYQIDLKYPINDFDIYNDFLVIQYTVDKNNYIEQIDKNNLNSVLLLENMHLGNLEILTAEDSRLVFTLGSTLYVKNVFRDLINIPITITKLHDERLLLTNGHEIVLYNYKDDWQDLID